jgi:Flp pilus assembly protein TadG
MMQELENRWCQLLWETEGTEIAEAAAVLPLMFMILLGIFWFGQAFSIYGAITRAAQEGARAGAAPYCTTCTVANSPSTNATNAINTALTGSRLDPSKVQSLSIQVPVNLTPGVTPGVNGISVSFQYPFRFWLPFTSLNKQLIYLTANARVRLETQ